MGYWDRVLGGQQPAPVRTAPPAARPLPVGQESLPVGFADYNEQMLGIYRQQRGLAPQQQQPQGPVPVEMLVTAEDLEPPDSQDPHGHYRNRKRWGGNPKGGAFETDHTGPCPNCGSAMFFSRSIDAQGRPLGVTNLKTGQFVSPKPRCDTCGYPFNDDMMDLAASGAKTVSVGKSRQGAAQIIPQASLNRVSGKF